MVTEIHVLGSPPRIHANESADGSQLSAFWGLPQLVDSLLAQGHVFPRAAHIQRLVVAEM